MILMRIFFFSVIILAVILFAGCRTNSVTTDEKNKVLLLSSDNDGKMIDMDGEKTFHIGDYLIESGEQPIWKKEIIGTEEIAPTYEKWGQPVSGVGGNFQVMRKVRHFQFLDGEVEYVYCRKFIGHDKVSNEIVLMPKQLKKSGKIRNVTVLKQIDLHTDEVLTKKL